METILRRLRRSSRKKKKMVEVDTVDEGDWAHAETLDLEGDTYGYPDKKEKKSVRKNELENEKRQDTSDDVYTYHDELGGGSSQAMGKYLTRSFSRANGNVTNGSTDFANEYYIKKKRGERHGHTNGGEYDRDNTLEYEVSRKKGATRHAHLQFKKYAGETKEFSEVDEEVESYPEVDMDAMHEELSQGGVYDQEEQHEYVEEEEEEEEEYAYNEADVKDEYAEEGVDEYAEEYADAYVDEEAYEEFPDKVADEEADGPPDEVDEEELPDVDGGANSMHQRERRKSCMNQVQVRQQKKTMPDEHEGTSVGDRKTTDTLEELEGNEEYVEENLEVYNNEQIDEQVEIAHVKGKGRCMFTRKELEAGSIIFVEKPLIIITPDLNEDLWTYLNKLNNEECFELPLKWHYAALCTITTLNDSDLKACIDKWIPEPDRDADADVFNVLNKVCDKKIAKNGKVQYFFMKKLIDPKIYDRIIQVWHYNAFGHHTDNEGLVLYNRISMLAHSCNSTACWHYGTNDSFVLRARVKLAVGDELTISYLGDDDLYKSSNIRREKLTNWLFVCMCSRCTNPIDKSRGFKCSMCGVGTFFIKSEYDDEIPIVTKCSICESEISESTAYEYIEYEKSYIERLQDTDKTDLPDALAVYVQAEKIFTQHWIMYQLYTILFEGYRDACKWEKAIYYQTQRIKYAVDVIPRANYVLAWLYEELGEVHANSISTDILQSERDFTISYEEKKRICSYFLKSIHLLEILCGYSHDYLKDSLNKYYRIDSLTSTDAPQIEE
ncbi:SET domain protein, putative [Plasmodium knowlesi strain H]|uniref:SET domain protein, putative n=3 Tax=Plasmodium knowlesi TaxID=5850 RepID=A0A5E7WYP6_PLAKH|nr:SET domain-containing protein 7, putative [Plasmodium knowlesi strain H]OTN65249.1 putative SET domain protein [Plasmodium knowlesi]CAA9988174.1 SET domain-containing protein 7, putative [Plasmodium knowlesi strain H]SBO20084.1 SET domain protein, putative [Plasmodium knowlesi strain H]SBO20713.1 SET domain protein, putative [Plasmodium knowlesi strain H]VVS77648.1 SET domain-containing protein 7, putative [Plasmodium knowlesi strain H]